MISSLSDVSSNEFVQIDPEFLEELWNTIDTRVEAFLDKNPIPQDNSTSPKISLSELFAPIKSKIINPEKNLYMYYHGYPDNTFLELFQEIDKEKDDYVKSLKVIGMSLEAYIEAFYLVFEFPKKRASWHGLYDRDYSFFFNEDEMDNLGKGFGIKEIRKLSKPGLFIRKSGLTFIIFAYCLGPFGKLIRKSIQITGSSIQRNEDKVLLDGGRYLY